ncbi:MAG: tRNA pseudouridine(38-40) synthase TruA [Planctomycetota bacterium]
MPSPSRRTLRLDLEFDGTDFLGWQRQAKGRTVQATVEEALGRILGRPHRVVGAGRTDRGVHARQMVASFATTHPLPPAALARALDAVLPPDVGVLTVAEAPETFHALRAARWKWYRYHLVRAARKRPLLRRQHWAFRGRLDLEVLQAGADVLRGRHDFSAFANHGSPRRSNVRTLWGVRWTEAADDRLLFDVVGDGFLYRMVRTMVGTLVEAARRPDATGSEVARRIRSILCARDRRVAGPPAPAWGLCLMAVGLEGQALATCLPPFLVRDVESARRSSLGGCP